eukprot:Skav210527  [mRNA]  locus=scaffold3045:242545:248114:+ [translate_table: standard]
MDGGHKEWLQQQQWYQKIARLCNLPMAHGEAAAVMKAAPMVSSMLHHPMAHSSAPMMHIQVPGQVGGGLQNAIGWAQQAAASPAGEELQHDAQKLAEKAKSAFEHQDTQELQQGAAEFMNNIKTLWEKNSDEETKRKAALLMGKAKKLLSGNAEEELTSGLKIAQNCREEG